MYYYSNNKNNKKRGVESNIIPIKRVGVSEMLSSSRWHADYYYYIIFVRVWCNMLLSTSNMEHAIYIYIYIILYISCYYYIILYISWY
jgi:hypothetical protein